MKFKKALPVIFLIILITLIVVVVKKSDRPDRLLEGKWEEVKWEYEKADGRIKDDSVSQNFIEEVVKYKISKHLVIHKAEKWTFKKGAVLILHKDGEEDIKVKWRLKGRGHILKLIYNNHETTEVYQINKLDNNKLILHFENDVHARGIVKIEFRRKTHI